MRKKFDIVRVFFFDFDIFFFDELFEGFDLVSVRKFKDLFFEMRESGKMIFFIIYNMYVVDEFCDRVVFIVDGFVRLVDNLGEFKVKMGKRFVKVEYVENGSVKIVEFLFEGIG